MQDDFGRDVWVCLEVVFCGGFKNFFKHQSVYQEQFLVVEQLKIESGMHKYETKFKL